jgi:hypothetical protein
MSSRSLAMSAPFLLVSLLPLDAAANGPEEAADFSPSSEQQLLGFEDAGVDTGWIPANSPVQLRMLIDAANTITIDLPGTAYADRPERSSGSRLDPTSTRHLDFVG